MPLVRANRDKIDDRFSVLGFTIRTESPLYEVGVATDPALFRAENRPRRNRRNFFSSRSYGVLRARRGEAVYMVPPDVLAQFVGQPRLYFGLATYREGSGGVPDFVQAPTAGNMYVDLSGLTERGLRRLAARPGAAYGGGGNDASLDWGGDAQPQAPAQAKLVAPVKSAPSAAPTPAAHAPYDDGFGDFPAHPAIPPVSPPPTPSLQTPAAPAVAAQGLGFMAYGRALENEADDDASIDGIPDSEALSLSLSTTPDYPGASRYVPAHASNYRASSSARTVDKIVIHITDGGRKIDGTIAWFQNGNQTTASGKVIHVSAHYVIGQDGEVVQMVRNNDIAWHAGAANRSSIGIEHVANTKGLIPTDAQYRASADLVAWLCGQYGLPLDRVHILGHAEADSKTTHRACPNAVWDWDKYMGYVRASGAAPRSQGLAYPSRGLEVPLTPSDGAGVCIDVSALKPADIILTTARHPVSYGIRAGTVSAISHAMLYVGNGKVIEAVGSGVREVPLTTALDGAILAVAYRHPSVDAASAAAIVAHARSKVGSPYNYAGVAYTGFRSVLPVPAKILQKIADVAGISLSQAGALYCSELVFESFQQGGLPLTAQAPGSSTPDDIVQLSNGTLQYVGHLVGEDVLFGIALALEVPLTPADGAGVCIDISALQPADIIVSTARHPVSYAIRAGTVSAISHAMLYIGNGKVIEAVGSGVREIPLTQAIDSAILAVAYRHPSVDAATAAGIVSFARSKVGSPYNFSGVAYTGYRAINPVGAKIIQKIADVAGVNIGQAGALFCSELVFEAFSNAGLPLSATPASASTPDDIVQLSRGLLQYVGHLKGEDVFLGIALSLGSQNSRALASESFSLHWPNVPYIAQVSNASCWAAATAMLVSWRDNVSISDREVADRVGIADAYDNGLLPEDRPTLARAFNLVAEAPASYGISDFRRLLQSYGPLFLDMTNSRGEGGHAWILVGMSSDGAEDGSDTMMYLHNPTRSRGKVKWSFPDFLKFYQNRVDTSGGVLPCQILHSAAIPSGRQTVAAAQFAIGLGQECFSIHWPGVPYVEQSSNGSCWAAATAMVVGWRDSVSISDQSIADRVGIADAYEHGLWPKDRPALAAAWNLVDEPPASYPIGEFRRMLESYGPIFLDMTNSRGEKGHAWVLVGMTSDGAEDGSDTVMYLHNPTASRGKVKWKFPDFLKLYENRVNTSGGVLPCQILHARAIPAGKRPGTAAQFALGLATPRALENESFSIHWPDVPYITQKSDASCWAAATAMVVSWRDLNPNLTDKAIADATPLPGAYDDGLDPADRPVVAAAWNLSSEAPASYGIYDFRRMLERYGPLYLSLTNSKGEGGHAWVLVGMTSDGAADGSDTMMYLHNPTASRGKVKWSFPAFLRLYERRVDTSGGVLPCQIMHAKAVPAGRQPVNAAQFALGLAAYEPPLPRGATPPIHHLSAAAMAGGDTIEYPVHLIPQPDKLSCWAASMAMLLSFRRNQSISPETLANEVGSSLRTSYNWDLLNAVKAKYGFNAIAQPSNASLYNSPSQWADWLKSQGPLWVVIVGMPHAVVISGIKGDLSDPAQCQVKILNPWDTRIDFDGDEVDFHPANHGYADWLPFHDFASDFGNMAAPNYGNWRVLTLPAASSQGLAWDDCSKPRARGLAAPPAAVRALGTDVSSSSLSGEPIDPPRIVGTRMARQRGARGRTTWALDQLEGVKQANPSPAVVAALTPTTIVLNDWPHLDQDPVPLPLTVSFDSGGGGVGNVRISAGAAADLNYDVTVTATIEDERQAGDQAAIRVTVDVDFANTPHGSLTARTLLKLYSNGRFDKDCRNL